MTSNKRINMYLSSLILLCILSHVQCTWKDILPWDVKSTLLDLHQHYGIQSIEDDPLPIYRQDLLQDEAAYWQIRFNKDEYFILSSGPTTGDYRMVFEGRHSPLNHLNLLAIRNETFCVKYYMISPTPGFIVACEDENGDMIYPYQGVEYDTTRLASIWNNHRTDVEKDRIWIVSSLYKDDTTQQYHLLTPGDNKHIMIGEYDTGDIQSKHSNSQERMCSLLNVCLDDSLTRIDPKKVKYTNYGQRYLSLEVPDQITDIDENIYMEISTISGNSIQVIRVAINVLNRVKRQVPNNATYYISDESLFPDYNQHKFKHCTRYLFWEKCNMCAVGCGPVAWAMVFGYFDRRSHVEANVYGKGSQTLFTCGKNGMFGNATCMAPSVDDPVTMKYITELHDILGTFCLFGNGATPTFFMDKALNFFKQNQMSGNPNIELHHSGFGILSLLGIYTDTVRDQAIQYIKEGWPVIIGMRVDGKVFQQHYPVATGYRERVYHQKSCRAGFQDDNCKDEVTIEREYYLHWGWGYDTKPSWIPAKAFFAGVSKY